MRLTGLEPARREHQILSLARLPIPPQARIDEVNSNFMICGCKVTQNFSFSQKFSCKFYQCVTSFGKIGVSLTHGIVGGDAEFYLLTVPVVRGTSREAHRPSVRQGGGEGHTGTTACLVAYGLHLGEALHDLHEVVGGGVHLSVGEYHDGFLPAVARGGLDVLGLHVGEVIMTFACLMLQITCEGAFVTETGGEAFGSGEFATAIAAYIHDESIAESEVLDDLVERALSHLVGEAAHVEVADVIVEDAVLGSRGDMVVGTEVTALQRIAEVRGVVLVPVPVASVVKGAVEVHMSVFQLGKHLGNTLFNSLNTFLK